MNDHAELYIPATVGIHAIWQKEKLLIKLLVSNKQEQKYNLVHILERKKP